ncbi:PhzA/PhzB family protein [Microbacterium sp.]|uniref:PhzA/PhzB family protein n=1 Tax=Microbacterium sp. TaxID=51671 RepID=UPI0039E5CE5C
MSSVDSEADRERERNRATVRRFFELPICDERRALYAEDGVKEMATHGMRWTGQEALRRGDEYNLQFDSGWHHKEPTIWATEDPKVFWVEVDGEGARSFGGCDPLPVGGPYVFRITLDNGKIKLLREWSVKPTPPQ